jgi:hypothetical protein
MYDFRKLAEEITQAAMTPTQLARRAAYLEQVAAAEEALAAFRKTLGDRPHGVILPPGRGA